MKKVVILCILAMALMTSLLAGCAGTADNAEEVQIPGSVHDGGRALG